MSKMHSPPHPGEALKEDVLPALGLSVTVAAQHLGVTRVALSRVLNGRAGVSAEMAIRIGLWLKQDPGSWLRMQTAYDLWQAQKNKRPKITPVPVRVVTYSEGAPFRSLARLAGRPK